MTEIHFSGITADAWQADILMPDDRFEQHRLLTFGASVYYTGGKLKNRRQLAWRPQTLLVDFNEHFVRHSTNYSGYGLGLGIDAPVIAVRLLKRRADKRAIVKLQIATHDRIAAVITRGLSRYFPDAWQHPQFFRQLITRYRRNQLPLDTLIANLQVKLATPKPALAALFAKCWAMSRVYEHQLDRLMTRAYLITRPRIVGNGMYGDPTRYKLIKDTLNPRANNPKCAADTRYVQSLFDQYLAIQNLFAKHQLSLYCPRDQERIRNGESFWLPENRHRYTELSVLP